MYIKPLFLYTLYILSFIRNVTHGAHTNRKIMTIYTSAPLLNPNKVHEKLFNSFSELHTRLVFNIFFFIPIKEFM